MQETFIHIIEQISQNTYFYILSIALGSLIITLVLKILLRIISKQLRLVAIKTASKWDDVIVDLIDGLKSLVIFCSVFYAFLQVRSSSTLIERTVEILFITSMLYQLSIWGLHLIKNWRDIILVKVIEDDPSSAATLNLVYKVIQAIYLFFIVLVGLSGFGIDVRALLAGLGIGGIAVALAAQNILGDLFASLSIALDKPFIVGDFIVTGTENGTVEQIGIKTTRIRTLSGQELVISNKILLESKIHNYKRMQERRIVQNFGVLYSTPVELLNEIPRIVKETIEKQEILRFDRCHFAKYGASSLDFEFVFYVKSPDYNTYMDNQEKILLSILQKFNEKNIGFAYPSQSLYVEKLPKMS